jgi:hypothetical protein
MTVIAAGNLFAEADAGVKDQPALPTTDESSIENFDKFMTIRTFLQNSAVNLTIKHYDKTGDNAKYSDQIKYRPNQPANLGFGVSWKGYGLSYKFGLGLSDSQKENYGKTTFHDWQFYYYSRKFGVDFIFQQYHGFSLVNPSHYGYVTGEAETKRTDLKVALIGLNVFYVFSDHYSMASSFNQSERMKTSGGSFLIMVSTTLFNAKADHSLIPPSEAAAYGDDASFSGGSYSSLGIAPGAAYTLVFRNFYLTPALFIGTGFMNKQHASRSRFENKTESYIKLNLRASAGYNGNDFFCGLTFSNDITNSERWFGKGTGTAIQVDAINIEFFFGKRIDIDALLK